MALFSPQSTPLYIEIAKKSIANGKKICLPPIFLRQTHFRCRNQPFSLLTDHKNALFLFMYSRLYTGLCTDAHSTCCYHYIIHTKAWYFSDISPHSVKNLYTGLCTDAHSTCCYHYIIHTKAWYFSDISPHSVKKPTGRLKSTIKITTL